jgi:lipoyl-dependent peroxiredoxin
VRSTEQSKEGHHHDNGGGTSSGTNPEQLFAAGWSACFEGAMGLAARKFKVTLPDNYDAEVDLCMNGDAYLLRARLNVSLPGRDRETGQRIVDTAQTCPCSKATRGDIDVTINLV